MTQQINNQREIIQRRARGEVDCSVVEFVMCSMSNAFPKDCLICSCFGHVIYAPFGNHGDVSELFMCPFCLWFPKDFERFVVCISRVYKLRVGPKCAPKGACPGEGANRAMTGERHFFPGRLFHPKNVSVGSFCCEHVSSKVFFLRGLWKSGTSAAERLN